MKNVAIVGTGLIGASFGLALRQAGFGGTITGVSSPAAIAEALASGAIDRGAPLAEAVGQADLIFLSQTIGRILDTVRHLDTLLRPGRRYNALRRLAGTKLSAYPFGPPLTCSPLMMTISSIYRESGRFRREKSDRQVSRRSQAGGSVQDHRNRIDHHGGSCDISM